ncbi:hypothetical protein A5647_07980 [Mycobacterium sp. 1100029.7]|nr:hypothetical protein A5647_07980 [Mycobacterium sp. 1100029.7]
MARRATTTLSQLLNEGGGDADFRRLVYNMLAFSSRINYVRDGLGELIGVSGTQYSTLITIRMLKEERRSTAIVDIADYLHVTGAFVTSEVNKLVDAGLVTKSPDETDRRRVSLSITRLGEKRLQKLLEDQVPVNDILFAHVSRREFETLCSVFARLVSQGDAATMEMNYRLKKLATESRVK